VNEFKGFSHGLVILSLSKDQFSWSSA